MRIGNLAGRLVLIKGETCVDVELASGRRFGHEVQPVYERWLEFVDWASTFRSAEWSRFDFGRLSSPAPTPHQVFAIGLNFDEHATETGLTSAASPQVFTKFPTCITGPYGQIRLPAGGRTDWEAELVVIIGVRGYKVRSDDAWSHVAGLAVGQDISERRLQLAASLPQFSLAKSYPGFGPIGPWLVTLDEFENPDDVELSCSVNGVLMQKGRTGDLIYSIPTLIEKLSAVTPLLPGDVIFTGTPPGVGMARKPPTFLAAGDELITRVSGIGEMRHILVS